MSATSILTGTFKDGNAKWTMEGHSITLDHEENGQKIKSVIALLPGPDEQYAILWRGTDGNNDVFMGTKVKDKYAVWDELCTTLMEGGTLIDVIRKYTTVYKG